MSRFLEVEKLKIIERKLRINWISDVGCVKKSKHKLA